MSDIRKDFDKWCEQFDADDFLKPSMVWKAYQAGRAHDVDGLIAEILAIKAPKDDYSPAALLTSVTVDRCIDLIRKHFGKE